MSRSLTTHAAVAAHGFSRAPGVLTWVWRFWSRLPPPQRSTLPTTRHAHPSDAQPSRSRPRVARAAQRAACCNGARLAERGEPTTVQPALLGSPWWDIELRRLIELLTSTARSAPHPPNALVHEVSRLAHLRGRTLDAVVSEALQLWARRELVAISGVSAGVDAAYDSGESPHPPNPPTPRRDDERLATARRRGWGEIDATLSALRESV